MGSTSVDRSVSFLCKSINTKASSEKSVHVDRFADQNDVDFFFLSVIPFKSPCSQLVPEKTANQIEIPSQTASDDVQDSNFLKKRRARKDRIFSRMPAYNLSQSSAKITLPKTVDEASASRIRPTACICFFNFFIVDFLTSVYMFLISIVPFFNYLILESPYFSFSRTDLLLCLQSNVF